MQSIVWKNNHVVLIDQRKLPFKEAYVACKTYKAVIRSIRSLVVRGAPAIGIAAAMGIALGVLRIRTQNRDAFDKQFDRICRNMAQARLTAVNLTWAVARMRTLVECNPHKSVDDLKSLLIDEAKTMLDEDVAINRVMGHHGQKLLKNGSRVLTHCNTGALATGGYGTALGVVRAAINAGKKVAVYAGETRPFLQGARLTTWELMQEEIPVTLITDNASGYFLQQGLIDAVIVGADRIAGNGDTANKIGTYMIAVAADAHKVPFYVAAPSSTVDFSIQSGAQIPTELRSPEEVTHFQGRRSAPVGAIAKNPAFDVTPHRLIAAIITEKGVVHPPFLENLKKVLDN